MLKRLLLSILAALFAFAMTACSYSASNIDTLLQPPKLSQQQNEIYAALESSTDKNVKLIYPKKGDFTSAFLINNIDDEPTQEAIVFYEKPSSSSATMPVRISVLDQIDGKWVSMCEVGVEGTGVEKVSFLNVDNKIYVIISFMLLNKSDKLVNFYCFSNGMLQQMFMTTCNSYEIFDIDGDEKSEIITIDTKEKDTELRMVTAKAFRIRADGLYEISSPVAEEKSAGGVFSASTDSLTGIGSALMDPNVIEYLEMYKGKLRDDTPALYIDCLKSNNTISTEILVMRNGTLSNLIYSANEKYDMVYKTTRQYGSFLDDLNNDGVYEIPIQVPALGYEELEVHQRLNFTQWYNYIRDELVLIKTTYVDYQLGFAFILPDSWVGKISAESVINESKITFYEYNNNQIDYSKEILCIKVMKKSDYTNPIVMEEYQMFEENGQLLYFYMDDYSQSELKLNSGEILSYFTLL